MRWVRVAHTNLPFVRQHLEGLMIMAQTRSVLQQRDILVSASSLILPTT